MKTINDWILVESLVQEEKKTPGGIILPGTKDESVKTAKVVQISDDVHTLIKNVREDANAKLPYKVGDTIYFYGKTGIPIVEDGKHYYFLKWDGMMAIGDKE